MSGPSILLAEDRDTDAELTVLALREAGIAHPVVRAHDGVPFARPLLDVSRETTRAACAALGLRPWDDPHNVDPAYARSRARALLGEGAVPAEARSDPGANRSSRRTCTKR